MYNAMFDESRRDFFKVAGLLTVGTATIPWTVQGFSPSSDTLRLGLVVVADAEPALQAKPSKRIKTQCW